MKGRASTKALKPRPLYVDGGAGVCLRLEGKSLRVSTRDKSDVGVPLQRVNRVCLRGDVELSAAVLVACCMAGVPVVVEDGRGKVRAMVSAEPGNSTSLTDRLSLCAHSTAARQACRKYFEGIERAYMLLALDELGLASLAKLKPRTVRQQLSTRNAELCSGIMDKQARMLVESISRAAALKSIAANGVDPKKVRRETGLNLVSNMSGAVAWGFEPVLAKVAATAVGAMSRRELVGLLEAEQGRLDKLSARWLRGLEHRLGEILG